MKNKSKNLYIVTVIFIAILLSACSESASNQIPERTIPVHVTNSDDPNEIVYVNADELIPSERHYYNFSKEFVKNVEYVQQTLQEVDTSTTEKWLEDFDRDAHPERELATWLLIADTYKTIIKDYPKDSRIRKEIYNVILLGSLGDEQYVQSQISPNYLSDTDITSIVTYYQQNGRRNPLTITNEK